MFKVFQLSTGGFDSNFSYFVVEEGSGGSFLVDPCGDVSAIKKSVQCFRGITPCYILLTHGHTDHTEGVAAAKSFFDAPVAAHPACRNRHDIALLNSQRLPLGESFVECLYAPGHSDDSVVYRLGDDSALFTGDTLFIDCCGYCDPGKMFGTMRDVIFPLADSNEVYPGHDYGRRPHAPLGDEKRLNPYLSTADYGKFCDEIKKL